jgi:hypothetical protein
MDPSADVIPAKKIADPILLSVYFILSSSIFIVIRGIKRMQKMYTIGTDIAIIKIGIDDDTTVIGNRE